MSLRASVLQRLLLAAALLPAVVGCRTIALPAGRWVDLTHPFSAATLYWPTANGFRLDVVSEGVTPRGYYYAANNIRTAEHGGTHIDAPVHFFENGRTVDRIPLDRLVGPAVVVDVSARSLADRDYEVSVTDLTDWEITFGRIPDGAIVLLRTRYSAFWPDAERYLGTARRGPEGAAELHFPGLHPNAAQWLVTNRNIGAIGIDTASIDHGPSTLFESHRILFRNDIPALENVANLELLPPTGSVVFALPMKIEGGSGAPLRIAALVP
ncbi:MAG: cyclase family protein [Planctomycetota bacterium]|jgi:kynurenine formamidase